MLKPVDFISKSDCTGCESCVSVCGLKCIEMHSDKFGFMYPMVDTNRCVDCGACERTCPVISPEILPIGDQKYYACRAKDKSILAKSSSGGIFTLLAEYILRNDGVVCGASFDSELNVSHRVISSVEELPMLRGSKYVQSSTSHALRELVKYNKKGLKILFVGTPCQVAGARNLLKGKNDKNLLFVEVVCHGVPSPGVYRKYLNELEQQGSSLCALNFRDKTNGWQAYSFKAEFNDGRMILCDGRHNPYIRGFIDNLYLRKSCFSCRFKSTTSKADITIGDLWGANKIDDVYADDRGASVVIVNTENGNVAFSNILSQLKDTQLIAPQKVIESNPCIINPTSFNPRSKRFFKFLEKYSVAQSVDMAQKNTLIDEVKISLKYHLKSHLKSRFNAKS